MALNRYVRVSYVSPKMPKIARIYANMTDFLKFLKTSMFDTVRRSMVLKYSII